jgi:hypothetical protein
MNCKVWKEFVTEGRKKLGFEIARLYNRQIVCELMPKNE